MNKVLNCNSAGENIKLYLMEVFNIERKKNKKTFVVIINGNDGSHDDD